MHHNDESLGLQVLEAVTAVLDQSLLLCWLLRLSYWLRRTAIHWMWQGCSMIGKVHAKALEIEYFKDGLPRHEIGLAMKRSWRSTRLLGKSERRKVERGSRKLKTPSGLQYIRIFLEHVLSNLCNYTWTTLCITQLYRCDYLCGL